MASEDLCNKAQGAIEDILEDVQPLATSMATYLMMSFTFTSLLQQDGMMQAQRLILTLWLKLSQVLQMNVTRLVNTSDTKHAK